MDVIIITIIFFNLIWIERLIDWLIDWFYCYCVPQCEKSFLLILFFICLYFFKLFFLFFNEIVYIQSAFVKLLLQHHFKGFLVFIKGNVFVLLHGKRDFLFRFSWKLIIRDLIKCSKKVWQCFIIVSDREISFLVFGQFV